MSELERIGRLMLYRNRILEKLLREISKDFPNMEIVLEEFERLLEAIDDLDNETIHTIAKLKEKNSPVIEDESEAKETDQAEDFEDWLASALNSLNGSDNLKNYLLTLKELGGVAPTTKISRMLGLKKQTISDIEKELESKGLIGSIFIADRKVVYFNHSKYNGMTMSELGQVLRK
ncbi:MULTISPECIES: helix-turn-helix domain-containing protein [unclassified Archaeoglobus]|jgi:hypothetical protein|uniref:hypothetical protein n=1 Tax=unclassified Archaeoglobus TaxID=2643606 RepID=UPI0025BE6AA8|nr:MULTISPECIES: hypothetical protein [unclassified Archaeoglobus]